MGVLDDLRNTPLKGKRICKTLVHPFTPTGIFPNRRERRVAIFVRDRINNRKRTKARAATYQEVLVPLEGPYQKLSLKEMREKGIQVWKKFVDAVTSKYRTTTIRHLPYSALKGG